MRNLLESFRTARAVRYAALFVVLLSACGMQGQSACPSLVDKVKSPAGNLFSEEQEILLGEVLADYVENRYRVIHDTQEVAHLQQLGDKILAAMPPTKVKYRFFLIDAGEVNGFSLAGGRIYIDRKLIASAKNEDEVAGVLGHEIGHIITHQSAFEISQQMRKLLHVTSVGDKQDILDKFHRLMDAEEKQHARQHNEDDDQGVADRVGMIGMATAGYAPSAYAAFWNRSFFVQNKTGNTFTDILRTTSADQKRLRGIQQLLASLPAGCGAAAPTESAQFAAWRDAVTVKQRTVRHANEDARSAKVVPLLPTLRTDLVAVRFSRDGKMLFAQDESTVVVFDVTTGKELFHFDADYALPAQWSPDSKSIVFNTRALHTEEWDVEGQKLRAAHEMVVKPTCVQTVISPDGRSLACIANEGKDKPGSFDLHLFDVATNEEILVHRDFYELNLLALRSFLRESESLEPRQFLTAAVSPDGNFLVIGSGNEKVAVDFRARKEVSLSGDFKRQNSATFAFQGENLAGEDLNSPQGSGLFTFPEGKRIATTKAHLGMYAGVTKGDLILGASPNPGQLLGLDFNTGKVLFQVASRTVDVYGTLVAAEDPKGDVLLGTLGAEPLKLSRTIAMPKTPLGAIDVATVSPNGKYLAASARSRGAVWDLSTGKRLYNMRGFTKVGFTDTYMFLDMPKHDKSERAIFRIKLGENGGQHVDLDLDRTSRLTGSHLVHWKKDVNAYSVTVTDLATGQEQWHRLYAGDWPPSSYDPETDTLLIAWTNRMDGGVEETRENQALGKAFAGLKNKDSWMLLEAVKLSTGEVVRSIATPRPEALNTHNTFLLLRDTVVTSGRDNRVNLFSATTGERIKEVFGSLRSHSASLGMICVENRSDELTLYDLKGDEIRHFEIGKNVRSAHFDEANRRLIVLGADQKARFIDLTEGESPKGN